MLRRALDLWSQIQRDRYQLVFDRKTGERDDLYWRMKKLAQANALYADTIHHIMDVLREDGNEVLHDSVTCEVRHSGMLYENRFNERKQAYDELASAISSLVRSTMPRS